jgi:hypothetical protein
MFDMWPGYQDNQTKRDVTCFDAKRGHRDSVATLVDFGDWICEQSNPISCLPPTPEIFDIDLITRDQESLERQLAATSQSTKGYHDSGVFLDKRYSSKRSTTPDQLSRLCAEFDDISIHPSTIGRSRSISPVPSLTFSQDTTTPSPTVGSSAPRSHASIVDTTVEHSLFSSPVPGVLPGTAYNGENTRPDLRIGSMHPSVPSPSVYEEDWHTPTSFVLSPYQRAGEEDFQSSPAVLQLKPDPAHANSISQEDAAKEVSYIEWDDDGRKAASRLARMKKSFTDLRAAERFISDANTRRTGVVENVKSESSQLGVMNQPSKACLSQETRRERRPFMLQRNNTSNIPGNPTAPSIKAKQASIRVVQQAKLTRRSSHRSMASISPPDPITPQSPSTPSRHNRRRTVSSGLEGIAPIVASHLAMSSPQLSGSKTGVTTPNGEHATGSPLQGKRKRFSVMTVRSGKSEKTKRARLGSVGRWMLRVLGCKKGKGESNGGYA